jgi:fluoroquinolone transport system permease protein
MKMVYPIFTAGLRQIRRDGMLLFLLPSPFIIGAVFRLLLPWADVIFQRELSFSLAPWYQLSDAFLIMITPCMVAMVTSFLMLEELDEGLHLYYAVTPAGGENYLTARLLLPLVWALSCSLLVEFILGLAAFSWWQIVVAALLSTIHGGALSLMVVVFSHNKVEGLAYAKLMGVFTLGLPAVWLVKPPYQYLAAILPSFWIGKILSQATPVTVVGGVLVTVCWAYILLKLFLKKTILS